MKKILILFLLVIMTGCNHQKDILQSNNKNLQKILDENKYVIVDVRTNQEYQTGHVVGAINIPYDQLENSSFDKDKTIIVYCQSGNRSKLAFNILTNLGYNVYDLGAYSQIDLPKSK